MKKARREGRVLAAEDKSPVVKNGFNLAELKREGLADVRCQWMEITPDQARLWLRNNFRNRPVSDDLVTAYARDMRNGAWVETHQGIAFNDRDELIDGQHRLMAIILAGVTVRMMVVFGLPSKIAGHEMTTMDAVDRGKTRSVADQLKIQHGIKHGSVIAQITTQLANICFESRTRRLSVGQSLDIYRAFQPAVDYVIEHRSTKIGLRQIGIAAAFAFALMTEADKGQGDGSWIWERDTPITKMLKAFYTGDGLKADSAIARLREFATSDEAKLFTYGMDRGLAELALQAIFQEQRGEKVKKLVMVNDGAEHFRKLQPERVKKVAAMFLLPGDAQRKLANDLRNGKARAGQ